MVRFLVVALLYGATAVSTTALRQLAGTGTVLWTSIGLAVTALVVTPRRSWPSVVAAIIVAEFTHDIVAGYGPALATLWSATNAAGAVIAASLIGAWQSSNVHRVAWMTRFLTAAIVASAASGALGAIGVTARNPDLPYYVHIVQWSFGDFLGILAVVPFGLVISRAMISRALWTFEGIAAMLATAATAVFVFVFGGGPLGGSAAYLILIPLVWSAMRLRTSGAAVGIFLVAQIGNAAHATAGGPFGATSMVTGTTQLQLFLAVVTLTTLYLAARAAESARYSEIVDARDQLIASVSHELRTPLTPIIGFSEMALDRRAELDSELRGWLDIIRRNGLHLSGLIDDLLRASQLRRGDVPVAPAQLDLSTFLGDLLTAQQLGDIELDIAEGAEAWSDPVHLTQIIANLLSNAGRYGAPPIIVHARREGPMTRIAVEDAGGGVPEWFEPHLFAEFSQVTTGDRRASTGLGLGLPIARKLAVANGGELVYRRQPRGSTFELRLPAAPSAQQPT
ncbi:MAG: MASE1 domain-containing protein [Nitriliruptoraceae bacterium]